MTPSLIAAERERETDTIGPKLFNTLPLFDCVVNRVPLIKCPLFEGDRVSASGNIDFSADGRSIRDARQEPANKSNLLKVI